MHFLKPLRDNCEDTLLGRHESSDKASRVDGSVSYIKKSADFEDIDLYRGK